MMMNSWKRKIQCAPTTPCVEKRDPNSVDVRKIQQTCTNIILFTILYRQSHAGVSPPFSGW